MGIRKAAALICRQRRRRRNGNYDELSQLLLSSPLGGNCSGIEIDAHKHNNLIFMDSIWSALKTKASVVHPWISKILNFWNYFWGLQIIRVLTGPLTNCSIIEGDKTETHCICLYHWKSFKAITDIFWQFLFELNFSAHNWTVPKVTETSLSCQHPLPGISDGAHLARFPQPTLQTYKEPDKTH